MACDEGKILGVLGGMGPAASALFYELLTEATPAESDQDHVQLVLLSDTHMPDRTGAILSGDERARDAVRKRLLRDIDMLERCGADALVVTCNTAHFFLNELADCIAIPVVHLVNETVAELLRRKCAGPVAVLATDGTVATRLYQDALDAAGITWRVPDDATQKLVMSVIYEYVKRGEAVPDSVWEPIEQRIADTGCVAAILGCTELSIVNRERGLSDLYIDPMVAAVNKCREIL